MREPLQFFAHGTPKGQPRARACRRGNHAAVYDPGTADAWKWAVRAAAKDKWDGVPFVGPIRLEVTFYMPRPKSHFRSNGDLKPKAPEWHIGKPDRDNLEKALMDALTTLGVWADDCQVCTGVVRKKYATKGGAWVTVAEVEQ